MIRALRLLFLALLIIAIPTLAMSGSDIVIPNVTVPQLSDLAQRGQPLFGLHCSVCHGENGRGGQKGPPLIDPLYGPALVSDADIADAIHHGARARDWNLGDMPPVEGLSEDDIRAVIAFLREVQRANGIE